MKDKQGLRLTDTAIERRFAGRQVHLSVKRAKKQSRAGSRSGKLNDACGVFGVMDPAGQRDDAAKTTYFGLFALQHRGQDSAGIAINQKGSIFCHRDRGLVVEAFNDMTLGMLKGHAAIGHVRYPSQGDQEIASAQPMVIKYRAGQMALALNGAITNVDSLRKNLQENGAIFQTGSDAEVLLAMLARNRIVTSSIEESIRLTMQSVEGAYAIVMMTPGKVIGLRDPLGIRPLCLGSKDNQFMIASESCAIDAAGGTFIRDIDPGEIVTLSAKGLLSQFYLEKPVARADARLCAFEFVYFARPDSQIDGTDVYEARVTAGRQLAQEHPCEADLVIGAPDSGLAAAVGYAMASGIPYGQGLLKNRYVARTFIQPNQLKRELAVTTKFSALRHAVSGKRILMVDDSIVRGTTTRHIVMLLKRAGAREVHMRIASPPVLYPCFYGVDTPSQSELTASELNRQEICDLIGADSLGYLSLAGLLGSMPGSTIGNCSSCYDGSFPAGMPARQKQAIRTILFEG